jgi:hypothetical protein
MSFMAQIRLKNPVSENFNSGDLAVSVVRKDLENAAAYPDANVLASEAFWFK